MRILFIGDIVGKPGRKLVAHFLPILRREKGPIHFVVVNAENAAAGFGLTEKLAEDLFSMGIDVLTSGNHIWDKKELLPVLDREPRILRPANYPSPAPGRGVGVYEKNGHKLAVINMQGRAFMPPIDCPFRTAERLLEGVSTPCILVDFHAEATAEKLALARYLDGQISALVGTHTHTQTADDRLLPRGTAYITDVGMTGGHGGVIGMALSSVLPKFLAGIPSRFEVEETDPRLQAVLIDVDEETGRALGIEKLDLSLSEESSV